jgi:DtxR family Mn-dependent transcriptional regulator
VARPDLGYSWDEVHREAEQLEHVMSEGHGEEDPIRPDRITAADPLCRPDHAARCAYPAVRAEAGQEARVRRAEAGDSDALRRLDAAGVRIGSVVKVMSRSEYDQLLTLQIRGQSRPVTLGPALTDRV